MIYRFPKNEVRRKEWCAALGITEIKKNGTVCSDHFDSQISFINTGLSERKRLGPNAVPRISELDELNKIIVETIDPFSENSIVENK